MIIKLSKEEKEVLKTLCIDFPINKVNWKSSIEYLFKTFFNPKTKKKTLFANLGSLKTNEVDNFKTILSLENNGLVEIFDNGKYILPRPLGVLFFVHGEIIPDQDILYLIDYYHNVTDLKLKSVINRFGKIKTLPFSQIAPLIFLLYNNNTSKSRGEFKKKITLKPTIDRINSAFIEANPNSQGTKDLNSALSGYLLTEANNNLGVPIINDEPLYYIKPDRIKDVEKAIRNAIRKNFERAKISFKAFEKAFENESKILFECGALYSTSNSKERVRNLFKGRE